MKLIIHDKSGMRARTVKEQYARDYRNRYKNDYLTWIDKNNNVHIDFCHRPKMVKLIQRLNPVKDPISYYVTLEYAERFLAVNPEYSSMVDGDDFYIDMTVRHRVSNSPVETPA